MIVKNSQKQSRTIKNGQEQSRTIKNGQERQEQSRSVKNGQEQSRTVMNGQEQSILTVLDCSWLFLIVFDWFPLYCVVWHGLGKFWTFWTPISALDVAAASFGWICTRLSGFAWDLFGLKDSDVFLVDSNDFGRFCTLWKGFGSCYHKINSNPWETFESAPEGGNTL